MVKLGKLLGAQSVLHFECMYTKHKTQKRKVWHDGFVTLYDSRRIVLCEEPPPNADCIEEAKLSVYEWDRKDEEFITLPRHLIEIINTTPLNAGSSVSNSSQNVNHATKAAEQDPLREPSPPQQALAVSGRRNFTNSKFRTPLMREPDPGQRSSMSSTVSSSSSRARPFSSAINSKSPSVSANTSAKAFDFDRTPTRPWIHLPTPPPRSCERLLCLLVVDWHAQQTQTDHSIAENAVEQVAALFHGAKKPRLE